jgi:hypothetical protein
MNRELRITVEDLSESYRLMAADEPREAEALEWVESTCDDVADDTPPSPRLRVSA